MKTLVVLSGGMDSATALYWAMERVGAKNVSTLSFDYGSKHNDQEYKAALSLCGVAGVESRRIALPFIGELFNSDLLKSGGQIPEGHYADPSMKRTVVPFRNGIMLSIAVGCAESLGAERVVIGNHFGDHAIYPDCRKTFIDAMRSAAAAGTYAAIEICSPFCDIDKTEIVKIGTKLGVPYGMTYSCYKGGKNHCGKCGTCYERKEAFQLAGVTDPTVYGA